MELSADISKVKGVGPKLAENFNGAGVKTVYDLLDYFPRRYDDYSEIMTVSQIRPGLIAIRVKFEAIKTRRVRRSLHITEADAYDDTGKVKVVWFNQPYRADSLIPNTEFVLKGNFELKRGRLSIINPSVENVASISDSSSSIVATYPEKSGLKSQQISKIISNLFNTNIKVSETLPANLVQDNNLRTLDWSYKQIHKPDNIDLLNEAKKRFAFEELFILMYAAELIRQNIKNASALPIYFNKESAVKFVNELPFKLTDSQRKVIWQIYKDLNRAEPMNRLLEGDVGSGKTVVAAMAILMALESKKQACFIAPTEILANQHHHTLKKLLEHSNFKDNIILLTGSLKKSQKDQIKKHIKNNDNLCLVGTHALMQKDIVWNNLGLVVVDEQHRFGVNQRQSLHTVGQYAPHVLCMTATPIPRSLALTVYGELDISILEHSPAGKAGYSTKIVSPNSTSQMYESIRKSIDAGRQAYIVCPLVEDSDILKVHSAEEVYKTLSESEFKNYRTGLMHGRLKPKEKESVMQLFKDGQIDVLISTTVIEVGVDVPNATEMVILSAERFGLAQLHQLRGRIGRGKHKGLCYLVMSDSSKPSGRMRVLESTDNGFELAQYDLDIRGPGAIYGKRQHGNLDLRFVDLNDAKLIAQVRQAVLANIKNQQIMLKYPKIAEKLQKALQLTNLN